jgi:hypothetical protein
MTFSFHQQRLDNQAGMNKMHLIAKIAGKKEK